MGSKANISKLGYQLGFCAAYHYPDKIRSLLSYILDRLGERLGWDQVVSVILYGSTSRGELSYIDKGNIDLFSDFELEVVTVNRVPAKIIQGIKADLGKDKMGIANPLFHVDISFNTRLGYRIKKIFDRRIANYEMKETGKVLYGEDLLRSFPRIDVNNLDMGNTNQLILVRLWMQLLFLPPSFPGLQAGAREEQLVKYCLVRNALDVLTIYLPNAGVLLPTYKARLEYIRQHKDKLAGLPEDYGRFLEECYHAKTTLQFKLPMKEYYARMLEGYLFLLEYLLGMERGKAALGERSEEISRAIIADRDAFMSDRLLSRYKRYRNERLLTKRMGKGILNTVKWIKADRRPMVLVTLLNMHMYIYQKMCNSNQADRCLDMAIKYAEKSQMLEPGQEGVAGMEGWFSLKSKIILFMSKWFYRDTQYVNNLRRELGWEED